MSRSERLLAVSGILQKVQDYSAKWQKNMDKIVSYSEQLDSVRRSPSDGDFHLKNSLCSNKNKAINDAAKIFKSLSAEEGVLRDLQSLRDEETHASIVSAVSKKKGKKHNQTLLEEPLPTGNISSPLFLQNPAKFCQLADKCCAVLNCILIVYEEILYTRESEIASVIKKEAPKVESLKSDLIFHLKDYETSLKDVDVDEVYSDHSES